MGFTIRMGIPEMQALWTDLQAKYRNGPISKSEKELYTKLGKTLVKLAADPMYPGLHTHEIVSLTKRYGMRVWQSYLENNKSKARRIFWVYGPNKQEITVIGLEPHPEDAKNGAYDRIILSDLEREIVGIKEKKESQGRSG